LRLFLNDRSAVVKRAALISLGRLNDEVSYPKIVSMLKDADMNVRCSAVLALGLLKSREAQFTLLQLADNTDQAKKLVGESSAPSYIRGFAVISLALRDSARTGAVESLLKDIAVDSSCSEEVRAMAIGGLGLIGSDESVRFLANFSRKRKVDYRLLSTTETALGVTNNPVALHHILKCLTSKHIAVRQSAALGSGYLATSGDEAAVKKIFNSFSQTADPTMKGFALVSIGQIGGAEAIKKLKMVLKRGVTSDHPWAALGLGIALSKEQIKEIPEILVKRFRKSRNHSTRSAAAIGLGLAGGREFVEELIECVKDGGDPYFRGYCAIALGMIGDQSAVPPLREALLEENLPPVRDQAAMALCLLNDRASVPKLIAILTKTNNNEGSKAIAARCLIHLGDLNTAKQLLDFINTKSSDENSYKYCIDLISKITTNQKTLLLDKVAVCSNYNCEFPIVSYLLGFGI